MSYIAVAHDTSPYITVYPWHPLNGFGIKYSDPGTLPAGNGQDVSFKRSTNLSPSSDIGVAHDTSPYVTVYPWSLSGFGSKYSNPGTLPTGDGKSISFDSIHDVIIGHAISPRISAYVWDSGFGSKYSNPGTLPSGQSNGIYFNGSMVLVAHAASPYISGYDWLADFGFIAKWVDPVSLPVGDSFSVDHRSGDIAVAHGGGSRYISAYPLNVSGFGTRYTNPATLPTGQGQGCCFSTNANDLAVAHTTSPYVTAYPWTVDTGFGTKYSNPGTLPAGNGKDVNFLILSESQNNTLSSPCVFVAHSTTPYITTYSWSSGSGFNSKYSDPTTTPTGQGNGLSSYYVPSLPSNKVKRIKHLLSR